MKVVYVGDNRNRGNFGCRATSTALSQLIEKNNIIVGTVSGKYTNNKNGDLFYYKYLPKGIYKKLGNTKNWMYFKSGIYMLIRFLCLGKQYIFSDFDYLKYDMEKSLEAFLKCLPANPQLQEFDLRQYDFDALVVNGEGSFIFRIPAWRESMNELMLMYWALKMKKKVYFMNGMFSDDPYTERNIEAIQLCKPIFALSEVVAVREDYSYQYAKEQFSDSNIKQFPDALFTWYDYINDGFRVENGRYFMGMSGATDSSFNDFDFTKPYICISGSSSVGKATSNIEVAINSYCNLVNNVKKHFDQNVYLVEVCEGDSFLREVSRRTDTGIIPIDTPILAAAKILANADVYISGRYHPAILASQGGTPCVFMSSNSHKTKSLQELLQYDFVHEFYVIPSDEEIVQMIERAKIVVEKGSDYRNIIKARCKFLCEEARKMADVIK